MIPQARRKVDRTSSRKRYIKGCRHLESVKIIGTRSTLAEVAIADRAAHEEVRVQMVVNSW
jgi:hypothetical protein